MNEPIQVSRTSLIERLNESLAERKATDEAQKTKIDDTFAGVFEQLSSYEKRALVETIRGYRENHRWDADPTDREATGYLSDPDGNPESQHYNPYEAIERVIRTLEMGTSDSVTVSPSDDVYGLI